MKTFDPAKPVQTRDGRPVRIICTDALGAFPIVAMITRPHDNTEFCQQFMAHGHVSRAAESGNRFDADLINIPESHEVVVHFYRHGNDGNIYLSAGRVKGEFATKLVKVTEGEFEGQ